MEPFIPTVDLSYLINATETDKVYNPIIWNEIANKVGDALHKIGFVYLINHGIDSRKIEKAFKHSKSFFEQPVEEKLKFKLQNATKGYHGGYSPNTSSEKSTSSLVEFDKGNINGSAFELRESYDLAGKITIKGEEDIDKAFHKCLVDLQNECKNIIKIVFKLIGIAFKLEEPDFFVKCSKWLENSEIPSFKTFRSLYYPAIPEFIEIPYGKARVKEHSDFSFLTLLFQDSIGGLEVKTAKGEWIAVPPVPNSILVNIGDLLELWTGGYYPATKHRVLIPKSEIKKRTPRQSIVYFIHPDSNTLVAPLTSGLLGKYSFKELKAYEYTKRKLALVNSY